MIDTCRKIYSRLSDDISRYIFKERLSFSLTDDKCHIINVITNCVDQSSDFIKVINSGKKKYIYGAGNWGREIAEVWGSQVEAFIDGNPQKIGKKLCDIPIISIDQLNPKSFTDYILIGTRLYYTDIYRNLIEHGISEECIVNVGGLLDELAERQYFDLAELPHSKDEVFADVGSLDAKTALHFIKWADNDYSKVVCFEPDKANVEKCIENLKRIIDYDNKAQIVNKGAWSKEGALAFSSHGDGISSFVLDNGNAFDEKVDVTTIDSVFSDQRVTFIKMDIEGAELEALLGCERVIKKQMPKLAICVYHKPEDIYQLPEVILRFNPNYKLYLRHYSIAAAETVLYAIP